MTGDVQGSAEIYEQFRGLITSGQLGAGERLPTVRQVARDLGVALGTAARAYKQLEAEGLVVSRSGAGTIVAEEPALLSGETLAQIRKLIASAKAHSESLDDVISVVRTLAK